MKRKHEMPFGAECRDGGTVRFRLWAPSASSVGLVLNESRDCELAMAPTSGGWSELVTREARTGTRYRFKVDDHQLYPIRHPAISLQACTGRVKSSIQHLSNGKTRIGGDARGTKLSFTKCMSGLSRPKARSLLRRRNWTISPSLA